MIIEFDSEFMGPPKTSQSKFLARCRASKIHVPKSQSEVQSLLRELPVVPNTVKPSQFKLANTEEHRAALAWALKRCTTPRYWKSLPPPCSTLLRKFFKPTGATSSTNMEDLASLWHQSLFPASDPSPPIIPEPRARPNSWPLPDLPRTIFFLCDQTESLHHVSLLPLDHGMMVT